MRWFRPSAEQRGDVLAVADQQVALAAGANPSILVTVESNEGEGQVLHVAIGGLGVVWSADEANPELDSVLRRWEVDGASEIVGSASNLDLLLSEFHEAFREEGIEDPRVVTAETNRPNGEVIVLEVSYFDPMRRSLYEDDVDW